MDVQATHNKQHQVGIGVLLSCSSTLFVLDGWEPTADSFSSSRTPAILYRARHCVCWMDSRSRQQIFSPSQPEDKGPDNHLSLLEAMEKKGHSLLSARDCGEQGACMYHCLLEASKDSLLASPYNQGQPPTLRDRKVLIYTAFQCHHSCWPVPRQCLWNPEGNRKNTKEKRKNINTNNNKMCCEIWNYHQLCDHKKYQNTHLCETARGQSADAGDTLAETIFLPAKPPTPDPTRPQCKKTKATGRQPPSAAAARRR